jgi:TfoX/Sxy family transcriptional regulator of competence genes
VAFDEALAERVRKQIKGQRGLVEKKMFGGIGFLANGNMSVGVFKNDLIVRLPPQETDAALRQPGVRIFDITGRPMKGWILVGGPGLEDPSAFDAWVRRGVAYAASLPKKK